MPTIDSVISRDTPHVSPIRCNRPVTSVKNAVAAGPFVVPELVVSMMTSPPSSAAATPESARRSRPTERPSTTGS